MIKDSYFDIPVCDFVESVLASNNPPECSNLQDAPREDKTKKSKPCRKRGKWAEAEDSQLNELIKKFGEKRWKLISEHMPGRSPIQCLHRWDKILKPGQVKGLWTQEEDRNLINWVEKSVTRKWSVCARMITGRNGKQCRERWINNLNPDISKADWTEAEDHSLF